MYELISLIFTVFFSNELIFRKMMSKLINEQINEKGIIINKHRKKIGLALKFANVFRNSIITGNSNSILSPRFFPIKCLAKNSRTEIKFKNIPELLNFLIIFLHTIFNVSNLI